MLPSLGPPQQVYANPYWSIDRIEADFGTFRREYFVSRDGIRAGVLVCKGDSVLLVRQYRLLLHGNSHELPGGSVTRGETPEEAAVRECTEETGVRPLDLKPVISYQLALDSRDNPTHFFWTDRFENLGQTDESSADHEDSGLAWLPFSRCIEMIFRGEICDSFSIIGLLAYHYRHVAPV